MKDLISNGAIIIAAMFLCGEIFKNKGLSPTAPIKTRMLAGIIAGLMGCVLMLFSLSLTPNIMVDLRHFTIIIIAIHGGILPTIITGVIMALFRIAYYGVSYPSICAVILSISLSAVCIFIAKLDIEEKKKWFAMNVSTVITISIAFCLVLGDKVMLLNTLLYFSIISFVTGYGVFYFSRHIVLSNKLYRKYKLESTKDFLTGLSNVRQFDKLLNEQMKDSILKQEKMSLLMFDIDYFKKVNDTYGHSAGDEVLQELAAILSKYCKSVDVIARVGGEEFCIILPDCSSGRALEVAERIRRAVEEHVFSLSNSINHIYITVSVGVATYPDTVQSINEIIDEADKALYQSKHTGRNKVSLNIEKEHAINQN